MRVNLYEQEYLSIEQIAQEWAKEPGKLQYKEIEQEIWKAYWLGHFADENDEPTFMVPYKGREYFDKGPFYIHIVSESDEEGYDKKSIEHAAIVYKEENGEFIPLRFWIKYLYSSSPTPVPIERFYTYFPANSKNVEEEHNAKFVAQIKTIVTEYKNVGKAVLPMEDAFTKTLIFDHILDLAYKEVTTYVPLHRAFLFSYLHSSGLLEFRPKLLPKWSGKDEDAVLMDADDEDYKSLSEQDLNFSDQEFENKLFLQTYLKPYIKPSHFIGVCKKLNVKVPEFLSSFAEFTISNECSDMVGKNNACLDEQKKSTNKVLTRQPRIYKDAIPAMQVYLDMQLQEYKQKMLPDDITIIGLFREMQEEFKDRPFRMPSEARSEEVIRDFLKDNNIDYKGNNNNKKINQR